MPNLFFERVGEWVHKFGTIVPNKTGFWLQDFPYPIQLLFLFLSFTYPLLNQASKGGSTANNLGTITGDSNADGTNAGIRTILTVSKVGFT